MASVVSRNLFDLLGEADVETKVVEQPKEATTTTTTTPQNETAPVQKRDKHRGKGGDTRGKSDHSQRGGFKNNNAPRGNDDNRSGPRDLNVGPRLSGRHEDENYSNNYPSRSSRGARPGERGRGRGGRRGSDIGGRGREFDRHSGTGKYDSGKKEKQGWGSSNVDWENKNKNNNDKSNEFSSSWETGDDGNAADSSSTWNATESQEPTNEWGSKDENGGDGSNWDAGNVESQSWEMKEEESTLETNGTDNTKGDIAGDGDDAAAKPDEPEEIVKTLDEYLSEKAQKVLDISLPEARKPNEGVDDSQWKDTVPLEKKKGEDVLFSGKEQSFKAKSKNKKSKNYLEIEQTFVKPGGFQRGGFQRGGRGGGGGYGRGGSRNRDDHDNRDSNRRDGGGERSYDNRDNRRRGRGGGGGGGGGNRNNYVNIDDQRAFPSLGTV